MTFSTPPLDNYFHLSLTIIRRWSTEEGRKKATWCRLIVENYALDDEDDDDDDDEDNIDVDVDGNDGEEEEEDGDDGDEDEDEDDEDGTSC
ncbi:unnamed protein product [Hymenolepis diminuta]|uniref:Uncharacterized protein n=1 Tax=Hymenolepis diminuta TaxID=6216 RepID=A0A0R3SN89_HYMDI|nr:unnamed protein product [Hymenolepis diminuta]